MKLKLILFILFWASNNLAEAQTFIWESEPEICDIPFVKIKETKSGDFFAIGNNGCKVGCLKLNKYGNLIWNNSPKTFSRGLTDFISYDNDNSFYVLGIGDAFPDRSLLFQIEINGKIKFERDIFSLTYYPLHFNDRLYKNKIVTCGYNFYPYPKINPILEFRSLQGDTLGKFEIEGEKYRLAQRIFSSKTKPGFLLFCGDYVSAFLNIIQVDTSGAKVSNKSYGLGENGYETGFHDLMEKDSNFYLLADLDFFKSNSGFERGTYIYKFNQEGDSIEVKFLELNYTLKAIAPTNDNGFIIAGDVLIKLDSNYKEEWRTEFKKYVRITSVAQSLDGGYYGSGSVFDETFNRNRTFIFKTDANGKFEPSQNHPDIVIYPNPVKDELRLDLPMSEELFISIIDLQGRKSLEFSTIGSTIANLRNLNDGVFILTIKNKDGKVIKIHKILNLPE